MSRALFVLLCLFLPGRAADFAAWKDSTRLFINTTATGANVSASVGQFPLLIRLDSANFDFSRAAEDGRDLRFRDPDGTVLPFEIERFSRAARVGEIWVQVPSVDALSDADHIVMHWNNPAAVPASDGGAVFDTTLGYAAIWHLGEDATGLPDTDAFKDATRHANHGDDFVDQPREPVVVGNGREFDGKDDYIRVPHAPSLRLTTALTLSAWVKGDWFVTNQSGASRAHPIVRKGGDNPNDYQLGVMNGQFFCSLDADDNGGIRSVTRPDLGKPYHVAATWSGTDRALRVYVNGQLENTGITPSAALGPDTRPVFIGGREDPTVWDSQDLWDGDLDEVRISRIVHTPQYIKLSYENQKPGSKVITLSPFPASSSKVTDSLPLSSWPRSRRLLLNTTTGGAAVAASVERFPLLVRLDALNFDFTQAAAGGKDLRFSDPDGTLLPHAVERWDAAAKKAEVWVRVPKVDGASKTDFIRMHWGLASALDAQRTEEVFDTADGWSGAWHLSEGDAGRAGGAEYRDASGARNHGIDSVDGAAVEGLIGKGQEFDEERDFVAVPNAPTLSMGNGLTFSAWIKGKAWLQDSADVNAILRKGDQNPNPYQLSVKQGHLYLHLDERDENGIRGKTFLETDRWYHVAATWENSTVRLYVDGAMETETGRNRSSTGLLDARALYLGGRAEAPPGDQGDHFTGVLDEIQIARVARSGDWIRLAYENQRPGSRLVEHEGLLNPSDTVKPVDPARPRAAWDHDTVIVAGGVFKVDSAYRVLNPGPGSVRLVAQPSADTLATGVSGVEGIFRLSAPAGGTAPEALLTVDTLWAGDRSLLLLLPGKTGPGSLRSFGPGAGSHRLPAGDYVLARDTSAPTLRLLAKGVDALDSSWLELHVEDNLDSLMLKGSIQGARGAADLARRVSSPARVRLAFRPADGMAPVKVSLLVADGRSERSYPAWPSLAYTLPRSLPAFSAPVSAPGGLDWGLHGLPVLPKERVTLEGLARESGAGRLFAALWRRDTADPVKGSYRILEAGDTLPAGQGLWLASESPFAALPFGESTSLDPEGGIHRVGLSKGWNLVTNPSLEPLAWPVSHADIEAHDLSPVKGLREYTDGGYREADTLAPWKGYFVYSRKDTTLELGGARTLAKRAEARPGAFGPSEGSLRVVLAPEEAPDGSRGAAASLRLGAASYARDGLDIEDEPMPVSPGSGAGLVSTREGRGLRTDLLGYRRGGLHAWKLAWAGDRARLPRSGRLRVSSLRVPAGVVVRAATAVGRSAVELSEGAVVELPGLASDTLILWAAPTGLWREGDPIPGLSARPERLSAAFRSSRGGWELHLDLPEAAAARISLHAADGRLLARRETGLLAPGRHVLRAGEGKARPRGLVFVTLELRGPAGPSRQVLKSVRP